MMEGLIKLGVIVVFCIFELYDFSLGFFRLCDLVNRF